MESMRKFGVNLVGDVYYEVEAENRDEAITYAFDILYCESPKGIDWDCNEVVELELSKSR